MESHTSKSRWKRIALLGAAVAALLILLALVVCTTPPHRFAALFLTLPRLESFVRHLDHRLVALLFSAFTALAWLTILHSYNLYVYRGSSIVRILFAFVVGAIFAYPTAILQQNLGDLIPVPAIDRAPHNLPHTFIVIAGVEELMKAFAGILALTGLRRPTRLPEGAILFAAAALGFATFENQRYLTSWGPHILPDRFLVSVLTHVACSSLVGTFVARGKLGGRPPLSSAATGFLLAVIGHGLYDTLIFEGGRVAPFSLLVAGGLLYGSHRLFIRDVMDSMTASGAPPRRGRSPLAWLFFCVSGGLAIAFGVGYGWLTTGQAPDPSYLLALLGIFFYIFHFYLSDPDAFAVSRAENLIYDGHLESAKVELTRILDTQLGLDTASRAAFLYGLLDLTEGSPWRALERMDLVETETPELRVLGARCHACLGQHQELRELLHRVPRRTRERFLVALNLALAYLIVEKPRESLKILLHLPTKRRWWWMLDLLRNVNRFRTFRSVGQGLFGHRENMRLLRTVKRSLMKQLTDGSSGLTPVIRLIWSELHHPPLRRLRLPPLSIPGRAGGDADPGVAAP